MWDGYQPTPTSEALWSHPSENLPFKFHDRHALPRVPTENGFNDIANGKCFFILLPRVRRIPPTGAFGLLFSRNGTPKKRAQALVLRLCQFAVSDLFKPPKRKVDHPHRFSIFSKSVRPPAYVATRTPLIRNPVLDYKSTRCNDNGSSPDH